MRNRGDHAAGNALVGAYEHARAFDGADAGEDALNDDEAAAGALWARAHPGTGAGDCPSEPVAFRRGCADEVAKPRR